MASNANLVILMGNLTRNPELRHTPSGRAVATLNIAVNRSFKNNNTGEWDTAVDFFPVVVWGAQAENCEKYLSKGSGVYIEGRLSRDTWTTPEGENRSKIEVVARSVQFLPKSGGGGGQNTYQEQRDSSSNDIPDYDEPEDIGADDEEIPF